MPFGLLFRFFYGFSGHYLTALFLLSLSIKLVLLPLNISQRRSEVRKAKLAPQEQALREYYRGKTDQKAATELNQKIMDLYSKNGYNPLSGCLPLLLQMPVLLSLYSIITKPLTYLCGLNVETVASIGARLGELALSAGGMTQIQMISHIKDNLPLFADLLKGIQLPEFTVFGGSIDLSQTPSLSTLSWLLLVPLLTLFASYATMLLRRKIGHGTTPQNVDGPMKTMQYLMPLMSVWISFSVPGIIGVYWVFQSLLDAILQALLCKVYPPPASEPIVPIKEQIL